MVSVSNSRRKRQGGQEIIEFALMAVLFVPMFLGAFVTGMGLIRSIQVNHVCRDIDNLFIHGGDFSTYAMQQLAQRIATGLNLQIGISFTGNSATNTGNSGDGIVRVSQIMWIGSTTSTSCKSVGAANCTNHDNFVFTQRVNFGNGSLADPNSLGNPTTSTINSAGVIINPITDAGAKLPSANQAAMQGLWQVSTNNRAPMVDGQVAYVVEVYAQSPGLAIGNLGGGAQYARYFF